MDLALLRSDLLSPTPMDGRWPADVPYPYCGVPESLERLGRGLKHLIELVDDLKARKVEFLSITEGIDTTTPQGTSSSSYSARWPNSSDP